MRTEICKIENKESQKLVSFENIPQIVKPLAETTMKKRHKLPQSKITEITIYPSKSKRIMRKHYNIMPTNQTT